jgi:4-hydroxybenzoate polyprenyltransferase
MQDDRIVGVKSSALALAHNIKAGVASAYFLAIGLIAAGLLGFNHQPIVAAWFGLAGMAVHLGHQIRRLKGDDAVLALALFKSNRNAGLLLFAGLVIDRLLAT